MEFLDQFPVEYDRLLNILSSIFGILGFLFGIWRYYKERQTKRELGDRERRLKETEARLEHLQKLSDLSPYAAAVRS